MYVEGFGSATLIDGVVRLETLHRNAKGETVGGGDLIIPASKVVALSEALQNLVTQLSAQATGPATDKGDAKNGKKAK